MTFVEGAMPQACKRLVTLADDAALIEAARLLGDSGTDLVVVCDRDGMLAGVISKTDVVVQISDCQGCSCKVALRTVMSRDVLSCNPGDRMDVVWTGMSVRGLKNLPVLDAHSRPIACSMRAMR